MLRHNLYVDCARRSMKIGKYEVEGEVGRGGFGKVYRAFDPTVQRKVAIKILDGGGDVQRFRQEATATGSLDHPHIVTVYDFGDHKGQAYIVMEYLEGQDLQQAIDTRVPFDLPQIAGIMSQVAEGLHCAHRRGIIHRDVKPANIMLLSENRVKLMDFGIARLAGNNSPRTQTGFIIGTVAYMSPEQFQDVELDARIDIWAYGLIYYKLLTGKHPFQASDQMGAMYHIVNTPVPSVCSVAPEIPEALGQVVDRCLSKDRDLRYSSLDDLRLDMIPVIHQLQKKRAAQLVREAQTEFANDRLDTAQTLLRQVLELDPAEGAAQDLRRSISQELQRRAIGPRLEKLLKNAEDEIASRKYEKAIEFLDTALRMDPQSGTARLRMSQARELQDRDRRTGKLLEDAVRQLRENDLTGAYRNAAEVLRSDPGHPEGSTLFDTIQAEIERRESHRRLQEGVSKVRSLIGIQAYDEAGLALEELKGRFPSAPEWKPLTIELEELGRAAAERARLRQGLSAAKDLLRGRDAERAVRTLEALEKDFPGEPELAQLLGFSRAEWKAKQREEALDCVRKEAAGFERAGELQEAMRSVESALVEFPGETSLLRLSQSLLAAKALADRQKGLSEGRERSENLRRGGQLTEALRVADAALRQHGPDKDLLAWCSQLEAEVAAARNASALRQTIEEGRRLTERGEIQEAIALLEKAGREYRSNPDLQSVLASAVRARDLRERSAKERTIMERAAAAETAGDLAGALGILEQGLREFADSRPLAEKQRNLRERLEHAKSTQEAAEALAAAEAALARGETTHAVQLAREGAGRFTHESAFPILLKEAERREREAAAAACVDEARAALGRSEWDHCEDAIRRVVDLDPANPAIAQLQRDLQNERSFASELAAAWTALRSKDLGRAEAQCRKVFAAKPEHPGVREVSLALKQEKAALEEALQRGRGLVSAADFPAAIQQLERFLHDYPSHLEARDLLEQAVRGRSDRERDESERSTLQAADDLEHQGKLDEGLHALETSLKRYPDSVVLGTRKRLLTDRIAHARKQSGISQTRAAIDEAIAARDYPRAVLACQAAVREYPAESQFPELLSGIERLKAAERCLEHVVKARASLAKGDWRKGQRFLADAQGCDPGNPAVAQLAADLAAAQDRVTVEAKAIAKPGERPEGGSSVKWIAIAGAAALLSAIGYFVFKPVPKPPPAAAALRVSASSLQFQAPRPGAQEVSVTSGGVARYTVKAEPWLDVTPISGDLPVTLRILPRTDGLAAGTHAGLVTIEAGAAREAIHVSLSIPAEPKPAEKTARPQPVPAFSAEPRTVAIAAGESPVTIRIITSTPGRFTSRSDQAWIVVTPRRGTAPGRLSISADAGLPPGTHTARVFITDADRPEFGQEVQVTATGKAAAVAAKPAVEVKPLPPPPNPVVTPPTPTQAAVQTCIPSEQQAHTPEDFGGALRGKLDRYDPPLEPHGCVIVSPKDRAKFAGSMFSPNVELKATAEPAGVQIRLGNGKIYLQNTTGAAIGHIAIMWEVVKQVR